MSEKSMKRKHKKSSSYSDEEDEKASKRRSATKKHKRSKGRQDVHIQESSASKHEDRASLNVKEDSRSTRHSKRDVCRPSRTHVTDQKPVDEDKEYSKTKNGSVPLHGHNCSSQSKPYVFGESVVISWNRKKESKPSKSLSIINADTVSQREEKISTSSSNEKSFHKGPSRSKKGPMTPGSVFTEQKEQKLDVLKKKCKVEEPTRSGYVSNSIKSREETKTPSNSKDCTSQERMEMVKKMCQRLEDDLKRKGSIYKESKKPLATTRQRSPSAKYTTSECSSNFLKNISFGPRKKASHTAAKSSCTQQQKCSLPSPLPVTFKIPKKVQPQPVETTTVKANAAISPNRMGKSTSELLDSVASRNNSKQTQRFVDVTPIALCERKDTRSSLSGQPAAASGTNSIPGSSLSGQPPDTCGTNSVPWCDQKQVAEELHLARSEKRLEVDVMQSYGELTCMDIDSPEEGATDTLCKQPPQQDLILILDTNILLSHLDYVKQMRSHHLGASGFPIVLIPWVVLQELDSLKKGRGLSGSVAHLACPAISHIYNSLKSRDPYLWGQSMQQAAESNNGLNAQNNDDKVLQCCLQYQTLYPGCALILCTNDKNLCSKAILSGVQAYSKIDLEAEVQRSRHGLHLQQNIQIPRLPHISPQITSPMPGRSCAPVPPDSQERAGFSVGPVEKGSKRPDEGKDEEKICSACVCELKDCLQEVLSDVLEVEMKAAYEDLWLEIVYLKPPWTLQDVLRCLKKHWIAVFGSVVPRNMLQTVLYLMDFFDSGKSRDLSATLAALREAKALVGTFRKSSGRVPRALSLLDTIVQKLQPQEEPPGCDVVMNDADEDKPPTHSPVSHQEVWALFENIWSNVCPISLEVFKALGFDPHTMQSALPVGGPPPPQDAVACLNQLSSVVHQLLQAFSSVLSSAPGLEELQTLLSIIQSNKIADVDYRLTATDLLDCFSQQDYRERLRVGGTQLLELKEALDRCVQATGQHLPLNT